MTTQSNLPIRNLEAFIASVSLHIALPLVPLLIEFIFTESVPLNIVAITLAMYSFSIGASSDNKASLSLYFLIGIISTFAYGKFSTQIAPNDNHRLWMYLTLTLLVLCHATERFFRHARKGEPYLEFNK